MRPSTWWRREGCRTPWLLGWSFGTDVALQHGLDPRVVGAVLLSPPLRTSTDDGPRRAGRGTADRSSRSSPSSTTTCSRPRPAQRFARVPQAEVIGVDGARHLWVGEPYVRRALDEVVRVVVGPEAVPLPTTWDGPFERHDDLTPLPPR